MEARPQNLHFVVSKQQNVTKRKLHDAIKARDTTVAIKLLKLFDVAPNEQLSADNFFWTCLHYACYYNSFVILDYLLHAAYESSKTDYTKMINSKTKEGYNLFMISAMTGSDACLVTLLNYGGVRLFDKDNLGLKASEMAKKYGKENSFQAITRAEQLYTSIDPSGHAHLETPTNTELLEKPFVLSEQNKSNQSSDSDKNPPKKEDQDEYYNLLKYGHKLPCVVCFGDKGWLKYAYCCGEPFHEGCIKGITQCPSCYGNNLNLSDDVIEPERAYVIYD